MQQGTSNPESIDEILEKDGLLSRFQILVHVTGLSLALGVVYNFVLCYFTGSNPPWTCVSNNSSEFCRLHFNESISSNSDKFKERCSLDRAEWTYTTKYAYSFITEYNLVCEKTSVVVLISIVFYIGGVVGTAISGALADTYGRKLVIICNALLTNCACIISSYINSVWGLMCMNFIRGCGSVASFYTYVAYLSEVSPPSYRVISANILLSGSVLSYCFIDLLAYFVREWRRLSIYATFLSLPVIIVIGTLPESPRWLLVKGRGVAAERAMSRISKSAPNIRLKSPRNTTGKTYTYIDLLRNFHALKVTILIGTIWFFVPLIYYIIMLGSPSTGDDMYQSYALSCIADVPPTFISVFLSKRLGHKKTNLWCIFISGLFLFAFTLVPQSFSNKYLIKPTIIFLARVCCCTTFCAMFSWTAELFPTVLRSQGVSLCGFLGKAGMIFIPVMTRLVNDINPKLPFIIAGVMAILASVVGVWLPETNNQPTSETYADFVTSQHQNSGEHNAAFYMQNQDI